MDLTPLSDVVLLVQEDALIRQELGFVILISIAALVAIVIRRIRLPYTVALVVVGVVLSFFPNFLGLTFSSEVILDILVPPLLFEATLQIKWEKLKNDLAPILALALIGTLLGTVLVGAIVIQLLDIPLLAAVAFGALISATDPVAVIAFFRTLGVSKRLAILVEGESLFNDGVAIVIFNLVVGAAALGVELEVAEALVDFIVVAFGGIAVGLVLGYIVSTIILKNVDDALIETSTTLALAFGSFAVAESIGSIIGVPDLHFSGILAVVAAGLMVGNIGFQNTSPTTKITLDNFWEFLAFVVNSIVFLAIGLEIQIAQLIPNLGEITVAVVAILLSRAVIIYGISWLHQRTRPNRRIPVAYRHVMYWGGLRGGITLALALTLTGATFGVAVAQELRIMTFGVVLFTLMVQGTTIAGLIRRLGLADKPEQRVEQQRRQALLYARRAGQRELERLWRDGILFRDIWESMASVYDEEIDRYKLSLREHLQAYPELEQEMYLQARDGVIKAERSAVSDAARRGLISEEVHDDLIRELDKRVAALELIKTSRTQEPEEVADNEGSFVHE
ncbi:MAG TPA: Na+/H+ antiporter [Anaerolineae bacterium]